MFLPRPSVKAQLNRSLADRRSHETWTVSRKGCAVGCMWVLGMRSLGERACERGLCMYNSASRSTVDRCALQLDSIDD